MIRYPRCCFLQVVAGAGHRSICVAIPKIAGHGPLPVFLYLDKQLQQPVNDLSGDAPFFQELNESL